MTEQLGWGVVKQGAMITVFPYSDTIAHERAGYCDCSPTYQAQRNTYNNSIYWVELHNAQDGRP